MPAMDAEMSKRNTRRSKQERERKTIGKEIKIQRRTLFFEFRGSDGDLQKVAVDCPPNLTSTKLLVSCTPGVRWYLGDAPLVG